MTVEDIDDAMGWPRGTARRRRWTAADRGGLPFADAELGGVALWFRSTFEVWQQTPAARVGRRRLHHGQPPSGTVGQPSPGADDAPAVPLLPGLGSSADPADRDRPGGTANTDDAEAEVGPFDHGATSAAEDAARPQPPDGTADIVDDGAPEDPAGQLRERDDVRGEAPPAEVEAEEEDRVAGEGEGVAVPSGLDLRPGQVVLAEIGGRWREARVSSRNHSTVLVEYQLDGTALGARVRRLGIDRIRVPVPEGSEDWARNSR